LEEVITRLGRVGFDNTIGFLKGGFKSWKDANKEIDTINSVSTQQFAQEWPTNELPLFDVRKAGEYESEHLVNANHVCLSNVSAELAQFPKEKDFYVHCAGGYRSVIAASILKARGYHNVTNIEGGYSQIQNTSLSKTNTIQDKS